MRGYLLRLGESLNGVHYFFYKLLHCLLASFFRIKEIWLLQNEFCPYYRSKHNIWMCAFLLVFMLLNIVIHLFMYFLYLRPLILTETRIRIFSCLPFLLCVSSTTHSRHNPWNPEMWWLLMMMTVGLDCKHAVLWFPHWFGIWWWCPPQPAAADLMMMMSLMPFLPTTTVDKISADSRRRGGTLNLPFGRLTPQKMFVT